MMRCPPFEYRAPKTVAEAIAILGEEGDRAQLLAGGTDLVPNLKRRQQEPKVLVSLRNVASLRQSSPDGAGWRLGAGVTLAEVASDDRLRPWAALGIAARSVASPHIRNVATLGGNLCLDTRCNYYNQTYEWRRAIDFCMKERGTVCWVAPSSPRCWAVSSSDTAPALIALGARVALVSREGEREIPLAQLYRDDGIQYLDTRPGELLTEIRLGDPTGWRSTYRKVRRRGSIDFPVVSVAAATRCDEAGVVRDAHIVLGAIASRPLDSEAASHLAGQPLTPERIAACAAATAGPAKPLDNTDFSLAWRKKMVQVEVDRALTELIAST